MSGPLTNTVLLLLLSLLLLHSPALRAKSLSAAHGHMRILDSGIMRVRRDLRDSLPYEAQMMSYPPGAEINVHANNLYNEPDTWKAEGLNQALQQLVGNDQRRDQEAVYLANLMRLLSEIDANSQGGVQQDVEETGNFRGPYLSDYDETESGMSMAKPQLAWQNLMDLPDPQLTQALLNLYRQILLREATKRIPEQKEQDKDQEVLRYLMEKILSSLSPGNSVSLSGERQAKRKVTGTVGWSGPAPRRSRRSLDTPPLAQNSDQISLLRVKRLGDEDKEVTRGDAEHQMIPQPISLQRMKLIDMKTQSAKHNRKRRSFTYDPNLLAQHILQYLPQ